MKANLLISDWKTATRLLFNNNPQAAEFSNNDAKVFHIDGELSVVKGTPNHTPLWVWGVQVTRNYYYGVIIDSGIIREGNSEISGGVFLRFSLDDILEDDFTDGTPLKNGITLRIDRFEHQFLEAIAYPDNISAARAIRKRTPHLRGAAILLKAKNEKNEVRSYWAISNNRFGYKGVCPFDGNEITLKAADVQSYISLGEEIENGFVLISEKDKFVLQKKVT